MPEDTAQQDPELMKSLAGVLADYRAWVRENGYDGDEPPTFWGSAPHPAHVYGVDFQIELDEDTGAYAAWAYPNTVDAEGWLTTDTGALLAVIPATEWPQD